MNLVLIGYRGTGKSVVGKLVSERLQDGDGQLDHLGLILNT